ncbi:hypothetical protein GQX73_g78 [Xylaria multiplex]|uniref:Uncharacterized protein n=1 Tax=Xylaria multiplex TaxID=323545 RepID=A0A7C8MTN7_9PEZI|nr:hypothetical protein GQX73_g78 [Xylaria multiplex]
MFYRTVAAVLLFPWAVLGIEPSPHCPRGQLCLTSFKQCYDDQGEGCSEPPGSYPWMTAENASETPALLDDTNYTISWVFGPDGQPDVPVQIQWQMDSVVWDTSKYRNMCCELVSPEYLLGDYSDTTDSEYVFNPGKVLRSFPTPQAPYMAPESAWFNASHSRGNILIISQPAVVGMGNDFPVALSQQFTVQSGIIKDYIQTQIDISRQTEYNKWRLGVSIGLGIGIPFLVVFVTCVVLEAAKKQARKQGDKNVEVVHEEALGW